MRRVLYPRTAWQPGKRENLGSGTGTGITVHLISVTRGIDSSNRGSYDNVFLDDRSLCQLVGRSRNEQSNLNWVPRILLLRHVVERSSGMARPYNMRCVD
jgi:hypothetical protein